MKKLLVTSVATSLLVSGLVSTNEAEATKANIDYSNPSVAKKAIAGKLSMDGFIIGAKAKTYLNKKYGRDGYREFWVEEGSYHYTIEDEDDTAFVDFQSSSKVSSKNKVITRIVDKNIIEYRTITRPKMLKIYGKPLRTQTTIHPSEYYNSTIVDVYKNITFFYMFNNAKDETPTLESAVIFHTKNNSDLEKWYYYAANDAGSNGDNMFDYISSKQWASY